MDHYERSKLADAIKEEKFKPEEYVIKEVSSPDRGLTYFYREKSVTPFI